MFEDDRERLGFEQAAPAFCPSVACRFLDGRVREVRESIWSAAEVFLWLSDNIQETFGLAPIEAMASGLPVVVSDWDGYGLTQNSRLVGGEGDDYLAGGPGDDDLAGGPGDDTIVAGSGGADRVVCGDGTDRVVADPALDSVAADCELVTAA